MGGKGQRMDGKGKRLAPCGAWPLAECDNIPRKSSLTICSVDDEMPTTRTLMAFEVYHWVSSHVLKSIHQNQKLRDPLLHRNQIPLLRHQRKSALL